jgi:hypothetical protein
MIACPKICSPRLVPVAGGALRLLACASPLVVALSAVFGAAVPAQKLFTTGFESGTRAVLADGSTAAAGKAANKLTGTEAGWEWATRFTGGDATDILGGFSFQYGELPGGCEFEAIDQTASFTNGRSLAKSADGTYRIFNAIGAPDWVEYKFTVPSDAPGVNRSFKIKVNYHFAASRGKYQLRVYPGSSTTGTLLTHDSGLQDTDTFRTSAGFVETEYAEAITLAAGVQHRLRFTCSGRNVDSSDFDLGVATFSLVPVPVPAYANIEADPVNAANKVLRFCLKYPEVTPEHNKGRVEANINGNDPDLEEVTSIVKIYIPSKGWEQLRTGAHSIGWITLQEFWTNPIVGGGDTAQNFRISLGIKNDLATNHLYWTLESDESAGAKDKPLPDPDGAGDATAEVSGQEYHVEDTLGRGYYVEPMFDRWALLVTHYKKSDPSTGTGANKGKSGTFRAKIIYYNNSRVRVTRDLFSHVGTIATCHPNPQPYLYKMVGGQWVGDPAPVGYTPQRDGLKVHDQNTGLTKHQPLKLYADGATIDFARKAVGGGDLSIYWDDWVYYAGDKYDFADTLFP